MPNKEKIANTTKKANKKKKAVAYITGSIIFTVGASVIMPKLINLLSDEFYYLWSKQK